MPVSLPDIGHRHDAPSSRSPASQELARDLEFADAVIIGLGAMIGAGVFAAIGPAAEAAGAALLLGLAAAAVVAYCNAMSSAWLAARYPESGGTYIYGRERLGRFWGYLAGWSFVVGKLATCAAMALTFGFYVAPDAARPLAVAAVLALVGVNYRGIERTAGATRIIVALVLAALAATVMAALDGGQASAGRLDDLGGASIGDILRAGGFFFFAFAGYARVATLGEEVSDPERTIPRAIPLALGITLLIYAGVAVSALEPVVRVGAAIASLGVLLSLIAGVSRTALAMGRRRDLPGWLSAVHPKHRVPHHAELAVGAVVIALVLATDLRSAIGFSSFTVLGYYAIANASAWTLPKGHARGSRLVPSLGLLGCIALAVTLPTTTVIVGIAILAAGAAVWASREARWH